MFKKIKDTAKQLNEGSELGENKILIFGLPSVILLIGLGLTAYTMHTGTFFQTVDYGQCQIEHGETVASWDGDGEEAWNQSGYHYQTKLYLIQAEAESIPFPNTAEEPPNYLVSDQCRDKFQGLVDTTSSDMRYQGAQAEAVRLGQPAEAAGIGSDIQLLPQLEPRVDSALSPPVFGDYPYQAAAFVDDSGRATLLNNNQEQQATMWCQTSFPIPEDKTCQDVKLDTFSRNPQRSRGYLFTQDNCPQSLSCDQVKGWYQAEGTLKSINYTEFIGRNQLGKLKPFHVRLEAASSFAPTVGAGMLLTYKYPKTTVVNASVVSQSASLQVQDEYHPQVKLRKSGPDLSAVTIQLKNLFPLLGKEKVQLNGDQLATLNQSGLLTMRLDLLVSRSAFEGSCYQFQAAITARSDHGKVKVEQADNTTSKYCIARPATATHTYTIANRGETNVKTDKFTANVQQILDNSRGWATSGRQFNQVGQRGDIEIILTTAGNMSEVSSICSSNRHCFVGNRIVINAKLWKQAPKQWRNKDGNQADYRRFSLNHYLGHWLGFGHRSCPGSNQQAPVMLQQAQTKHDCRLNPWPTEPELEAVTSS